jgi:hypothetical protein
VATSPNPITAPSAPRSAPRRRWRLILWGILAAALLVLAVVAYFVWQMYESERRLAEVVAETDQLDPGWRLTELEANRDPVPPEQDAAAIIARIGDKAVAILNTGTVRQNLHEVSGTLEDIHPARAPTAQQTAKLRAALAPLAPVLTEAHKVIDLPRGRFPTNVKPTLSWTVWNADQVNIVSWLLVSEAVLRLQDDHANGAWSDCLTMLNVARALGDEPVEVVQLVRAHNAARSGWLMERTLAHFTIDEARLAKAQARIADELNHPTLWIALRGSRALVDHSFQLLETGRASLAEAKRMVARTPGPPGVREEIAGYLDRGSIRPAHAWVLRYMNEAVKIAKGPEIEVEPGLEELQGKLADAPELARTLAPKFDRMIVHPKRWRTQLRCALAGLAVERYRLAHDAWPASLDDLVAAKLLTSVPIDPYDGKALRYRPTPDGVVVFSIGQDGRGNGAALDADPPTAAEDRVEFWLWDAGRRGQRP